MDTLKKLMLGLVMIAGLSLAASAQRNDDQKKPPPKDPPPKVEPRGDKPPPRPPRDPKKPGSEYSVVWREENRFTA